MSREARNARLRPARRPVLTAGAGVFTGATGPSTDFLQALTIAGADDEGGNTSPADPAALFEIQTTSGGTFDLDLRAAGISGRLERWLHAHQEMPGAEFLTAMVPWAVQRFRFDPDRFVHELVDSIIGDHYPVPNRMLVHNERIVHEYLEWAMCGTPRPAGTFKLYAVEGGTAAMCYIFKSLKANRLLNAGDTIAMVTPIFTPYLEMPHLEDYDMKIVSIPAPQEQRWQFTDEDLAPPLDPTVKSFFVVNPVTPYAVPLIR